MAEADNERVWEMMEKIAIAMLTTKEGDSLRSRPMGAYVRPKENAVYFLTDNDSHPEREISAFPGVCLAFADAGSNKYVSVAGTAALSNDRAKIKDLWSPIAKAWWDSPDDPRIRLLTVTPRDAEYWDSPGTVVSYVKMLTAAVAGGRPNLGESRKVAL